MITLDLSILNQKGTPMFYSDPLAARPNFGIVGRIFIDTTSPYGIYRDTGSAWVLIASAVSGITGGGTLNTIPLFTPSGTAIGDSQITQTGTNVTVTARNLIVTNGNLNLSHTHGAVNGLFNPFGEQIAVTNTINAGITWTALLAFFNTASLQNNQWNGSATFGNGSYTTNTLNLSPITFNAAGATITSTQASGGIRAWANQILQLRIDGTNNGTYTHYANSVIYGDFAASTARLTITNRYGYLVNNLDEYSAGHTYTNRWAFYNAGISDNNFFAGKVGIGSGYVPSTFLLDVLGETRFNGVNVGIGGGSFVTNTAIGANALILNTAGVQNVALGQNALNKNQGSNNVGLGRNALTSQTFAGSNVGIGSSAGSNITTGSSNVAIGTQALQAVTTQGANTAIGHEALFNATVDFTTAIGWNALKSLTTGVGNTALGWSSLISNTTGTNNTGIGNDVMRGNNGVSNTAIGTACFRDNLTGSNNVVIGVEAARFISGGGTSSTIQDNSIFIGNSTRPLANNQTNQIIIGNATTGAGSNTVTLGNTSIVKTILRGTINAANTPSSPAGLVAGDIWNNLGVLTIV